MADTAATVNEITTHLFGDALARDLSFGSRIPRAMSARALSSQALDAALNDSSDPPRPDNREAKHDLNDIAAKRVRNRRTARI